MQLVSQCGVQVADGVAHTNERSLVGSAAGNPHVQSALKNQAGVHLVLNSPEIGCESRHRAVSLCVSINLADEVQLAYERAGDVERQLGILIEPGSRFAS